jgi:peptidylprolyl isomerase
VNSLLHRRPLQLATTVVIGVVLLAGCGGPSSSVSTSASASVSASGAASASAAPDPASPSAAPSPSGVAAATGPVKPSKVGVSVTGNFGDKPALTIPAGAAPATVSAEVLAPGTGAVVAKGQSIVVNYLGQTWAPKDGKANIFDNSYDRRKPAGFAIGTGQVIPGWDETIVGQKVGSRLLLTLPPDKAYGTATGASDSPLGGQTLVFVVDVVGALDAGAAATGTAVTPVPAGFPQVTSESGKQPAVTAVTGVTVPTGTEASSTLLLKGDGAGIDANKLLALQVVQTDTATGKQSKQTWGKALDFEAGSNVLSVAKALSGQKVGSRVVIVTPKTASAESLVLVVDVVGQF